MENQSNFVNKYKTKYTDYNLGDTPCQTYDIYKHGSKFT